MRKDYKLEKRKFIIGGFVVLIAAIYLIRLYDLQINDMINYSYDKLKSAGYKPYYMYKQKNMIGNLENIGYFLNNPCVFNIDSMEEFSSIVACGANAISKRIFFENNRIERFANVKNIMEYINRIDEMIDKKYQLFQ